MNNANREEFVQDYVYWLLWKSVRDQVYWFCFGFHRLIEADILRTVTPMTLKSIVEGDAAIDTRDLEHMTSYRGWAKHDPYLQDFWDIVHNYDTDQKRRLLQFITSSDRVPIGGDSVDGFITIEYAESEEEPVSTCIKPLA